MATWETRSLCGKSFCLILGLAKRATVTTMTMRATAGTMITTKAIVSVIPVREGEEKKRREKEEEDEQEGEDDVK